MTRPTLSTLVRMTSSLFRMTLHSEYGRSPGEVEGRFVKAAHLAFAALGLGLTGADLDTSGDDPWTQMLAADHRRDVQARAALTRPPSELTWTVARRLLAVADRYRTVHA